MTAEGSSRQEPREGTPDKALAGRIALVAGATRGAGRAMAVQLGAAGATVYVTGRTTRSAVSEVGRSTETIEETAELVTAAGGTGIAVPTDHLDPEAVARLVARIDAEQGRLDLLINDIWGGDHLMEHPFTGRMWEFPLANGLRMQRLGVETHLITSSHALPLLVRNPGGLLVEVTDGTEETNRFFRGHVFYELAKWAPIHLARMLGQELAEYGCTAVCVTPGWLRSEAMLDTYFGVTEENWRDGIAKDPHFAISESPAYLARGVAALAADPEVARWNGRSLSSADLAEAYGVTDVDGSRPDAWAYLRKAYFEGRRVDPEEYR